jgi:hypothetical protein
MITRESLQFMFGTARTEDSWDIDGVCAWSYFFSRGDERKLRAAADQLAAEGFRLVGIESGRLHLERTERHTVDSLDELNQRLYRFADDHGLTYDGMDVGPRMIRLGSIMASKRVGRDRHPVGYLYREAAGNEADSGWRVFAGNEIDEYVEDAENFAMYDASTIIALDPRISPLLGRPAPVAFALDEATGDFVEVQPE